ncbi:MAG: hypothetical protein RSD49_01600 [Hafnia sp.]
MMQPDEVSSAKSTEAPELSKNSYLTDEDLRDIERGSNIPSLSSLYASLLIFSIGLVVLVNACKA